MTVLYIFYITFYIIFNTTVMSRLKITYHLLFHEAFIRAPRQHCLNTLRTGLLNCLNARSRGLIQREVRFL